MRDNLIFPRKLGTRIVLKRNHGIFDHLALILGELRVIFQSVSFICWFAEKISSSPSLTIKVALRIRIQVS